MRRSELQARQPVEQFFQYSLLGLLASGYFALAGSGSLDLPSVALTGLGLLLRLLLIAGVVRADLSGRWVAAATLGYFGLYPLDVLYLTREFIPATIHLICFLSVVRVLTAKTDRDFFFVKVLAFLELLAATLVSSSVNFFLFLTLFVIFGVATFCCTEIRRASRLSHQVVLAGPANSGFSGRLAVLTGLVTLGIVVMTGCLFFLLPRTARAAFRSLVSERYHLPGFSGEVTLGQIGELKQQSTPVMHVRLEAPNERLSLKWRGSALSQFDGRRWYNPPAAPDRIRLLPGRTPLASDFQRRRPGQRISYEVRIGPVDTDALFLAGIPEFLQMDDLRFVYHASGDSWRTGLGTVEGSHYRAIGHLPRLEAPPDTGFVLDEKSFREYLLLPASTDKRIFELARELGHNLIPGGPGAHAEGAAQAIEQWLRTQFGYTTDLPKETVADPLAHFLFERRKGHCEYFASAMAVMLRSVRIPSRVVTGFQSGTYNPMTGWHVIRASDAHSWVEAWIPGRGWTTYDPTPPDLRGQQGAAVLWSKIMLYFDAAETLWRDWVVNYTLDSQIDLVSRVERRSRLMSAGAQFNDDLRASLDRSAQWLRPVLGYAAVVIVLGIALWFGVPALRDLLRMRRNEARVWRGQAVASDAGLLYTRMLKTLRTRGLEKPGWLTPAEFARIVPATSPDAVLVEQITAAYHDLRYAGHPEAGPRMIHLLQELETHRP